MTDTHGNPSPFGRERSFESCQDDIRNRCDTAFLQIKPLLTFTQHDATYFPNDKRPPDDPDYNYRNR